MTAPESEPATANDRISSLLSDAHCHADTAQLIAIQRKYGIHSVISCANGDQWRQASHWLADTVHGNASSNTSGELSDSPSNRTPDIRLSFGIHPWDANRYQFADALPYLEQTAIVGEIGLDGEWTDVPLAQQLPVFEAQLDYASRAHKPVVLHTKSREREVLDLIRRYPNRYMVHWYACERWQYDYLDLGCYMSIGPDLQTDESVRALAQRIPDDRLLIESDGLESLSWARGRKYGIDEYVGALVDLLRSLTMIRSGTGSADTAEAANIATIDAGAADTAGSTSVAGATHAALAGTADADVRALAALTCRNLVTFLAPVTR